VGLSLLRNARLPHQHVRVGRRVLAGGVAFTDVGARPAMARGAIRQKGYEPRVLLRAGQVRDVRGVYRSLRIGFSGIPDERHLVQLGDGKSKTVP
jgi:hypothetical protein